MPRPRSPPSRNRVRKGRTGETTVPSKGGRRRKSRERAAYKWSEGRLEVNINSEETHHSFLREAGQHHDHPGVLLPDHLPKVRYRGLHGRLASDVEPFGALVTLQESASKTVIVGRPCARLKSSARLSGKRPVRDRKRLRFPHPGGYVRRRVCARYLDVVGVYVVGRVWLAGGGGSGRASRARKRHSGLRQRDDVGVPVLGLGAGRQFVRPDRDDRHVGELLVDGRPVLREAGEPGEVERVRHGRLRARTGNKQQTTGTLASRTPVVPRLTAQ